MEQNNSSDLLLVIDMQNVYTKGQEWACKGIEHASASILRLLNSQKTKQVIFRGFRQRFQDNRRRGLDQVQPLGVSAARQHQRG